MNKHTLFPILFSFVFVILINNGEVEFSEPSFEKNPTEKVKTNESEISNNVLEINNSDFLILHNHDFENNSLGTYNSNEHDRDWDRTYWNRPGHPNIVLFEGKKVARNLYEQGKWGTQTGSDFGGRLNPIKDEIYYTYQVYFEKDFHWGKAVKFPGFRMHPTMGAGNGLNPGDGGSTIRFQTNNQGKLRWYVYHHKMSTRFGDNLGWDGFQLSTGKWHTITFRVVLNSPGRENGIIQVWVDGILADSKSNLMFRTSTSIQEINQQAISTFMGGNDSSFAPNKTQYMWMDNFFVWRYSNEFLNSNPNVARGFKLHGSDYKIYTPLDGNIENIQDVKLNLKSYPEGAGRVIIKN